MFAGIITAIVGLGIKLWLAAKEKTARLLGRAETQAEQAKETVAHAEEARRAEDAVRKLPDASVDDELSKWSRPGDRK